MHHLTELLDVIMQQHFVVYFAKIIYYKNLPIGGGHFCERWFPSMISRGILGQKVILSQTVKLAFGSYFF